MLLCQEINEVHYTHIFHASVWHAYCLHKNTALFKKEKNSEGADIRYPLFKKQQFLGGEGFFQITIFHRLQRKLCFSKYREPSSEIKFTILYEGILIFVALKYKMYNI